MKRIILMIGILFLITDLSLAADQKLDRKQIYELRKECGKSAVEYAQRWKLCDGKSNYQNHYNMKLNACFIYMSAYCNPDKENEEKYWVQSVYDVNENKEYPTYIGSGKLIDDEKAWCYVGSIHCKSLAEFMELIKPYMKE